MELKDILEAGLNPKVKADEFMKLITQDKSESEIKDMFDFFEKRLKETKDAILKPKVESKSKSSFGIEELINELTGKGKVKEIKTPDELSKLLEILKLINEDTKDLSKDEKESEHSIPKEVKDLFNKYVKYDSNDGEVLILGDGCFLSIESDNTMHFVKDKIPSIEYSEPELKIGTFKDLKEGDVYLVYGADIEREQLSISTGEIEDDNLFINYMAKSDSGKNMIMSNSHLIMDNKKLVIVKR